MSLDIYLECPCCKSSLYERFNITHNLARMAREAGFYDSLWRIDEMDCTPTARELLPEWRAGLAVLEGDPEKFSVFDASNGWGTYKSFVPWLKQLIEAAEEYPGAAVRIWR